MMALLRCRGHAVAREMRRIGGASCRSMCSPASPQKDDNDDKTKSGIFDSHKPQLTQALIAGGVGITLYGLGSFIFDVTYGLMSMTPLQSGYYGFVTGFATAGMGGSLLYYGKQNISVNPHSALWRSLKAVNSHEVARTVMGGSLTAGELAAFSHTRGYWQIASWRPEWVPGHLKMIYNVYTNNVEGVVSVEAVQNGLHTDVTFIGLDVFNEHDSRILVRGNAKGFESHDAMRAIVSFKSMKK